MATRIAWWMNLDAALELEEPRGYVRARRLDPRMRELATRMTTLVRECDVVIEGPGSVLEYPLALAFCPTPRALLGLAELGYVHPACPSVDVLREVNRRAFATRLGQTLPGAAYVSDMAELEAHLHEPTGAWLLKRDFAFAGRERLIVPSGPLSSAALGFVKRSFSRGQGLQVEPLVARQADFAQHGYVLANGELLIGPPMVQRCDVRGTWQTSRLAAQDELQPSEHRALRLSVVEAGAQLHRAGYFGPFGVDAFRYLTPRGEVAFQRRSEVNARFSMGYPRTLLEEALARVRGCPPALEETYAKL